MNIQNKTSVVKKSLFLEKLHDKKFQGPTFNICTSNHIYYMHVEISHLLYLLTCLLTYLLHGAESFLSS